MLRAEDGGFRTWSLVFRAWGLVFLEFRAWRGLIV